MNADAKALLAAIVADPADDTVRLAFADCIEEDGHAPRAQFIRLQVDAECHHPDSAKRATLNAQASALFAEHWIDWWADVCKATKLDLPARKPASRLARLAHRFGLRADEGGPYEVHLPSWHWPWFGVRYGILRPIVWEFAEAVFHRGFPETIRLSGLTPAANSGFLSRWRSVSPLSRLDITAHHSARWHDGPHLADVRSIRLGPYRSNAAADILASPHLKNLRELRLERVSYDADGQERVLADLSQSLAAPRVRELTTLGIPLVSLEVAERVAQTENLAGLECLEVNFWTAGSPTPTGGWLAPLACSPHLKGLRELTLTAPFVESYHRRFDPRELRIIAQSGWPGLRKLTLIGELEADSLAALLTDSKLPALEELRIGNAFDTILLNREALHTLIRSPLLKQVRHLAFAECVVDGVSDAELRRLPEIFDRDRIETFSFSQEQSIPGLCELSRVLGDRLRLPP